MQQEPKLRLRYFDPWLRVFVPRERWRTHRQLPVAWAKVTAHCLSGSGKIMVFLLE